MIRRFRRYAGENGHRAAVAKAVAEARDRVYSTAAMMIVVKDLDEVLVPGRSSGVEVVPLDESRLAGLSELNRARGRPRVDRRFRSNLRRGMRGFVGVKNGVTVGYYWWVDAASASSHPDLDWLGDFARIADNDVYGSDYYVLPEHRSGGTSNDMLFQIECNLRDSGFERIWGYVLNSSREARWLYSSRGYRPMEEVHSRRLLFHRRVAKPRK
ncbi:MAG: hypothetical protein ACJ76D_00225 [Solirubrobacterales bacterium]